MRGPSDRFLLLVWAEVQLASLCVGIAVWASHHPSGPRWSKRFHFHFPFFPPPESGWQRSRAGGANKKASAAWSEQENPKDPPEARK
eukprot:2472714-Pyramimonas_sp.AAC.1